MERFSMETENGEKVYKDHWGDKIETYEETIEWILSYKFDPLRDFLKMMLEKAEVEMEANIALALFEGAEKYLFDAIRFIRDQHGEVEVVRAMYHQGVKPETMLDIKIRPCDAKKQAAVA